MIIIAPKEDPVSESCLMWRQRSLKSLLFSLFPVCFSQKSKMPFFIPKTVRWGCPHGDVTTAKSGTRASTMVRHNGTPSGAQDRVC